MRVAPRIVERPRARLHGDSGVDLPGQVRATWDHETVDLVDAPAAGINAPERTTARVSLAFQGLFGRLSQRPQGCRQLGGATEKPIDHDFAVARRQDPPQLPPPAVALFRKGAFGGKGGLFPTGHAGHIHIEHL